MMTALLIVFIGGAFILGGEIGRAFLRKEYRDEALKEDRGEYYIDENHKRKWRWKP